MPLLGLALLQPQNIPRVLQLLGTLRATLAEAHASQTTLTTSLIQYVFFPLSTILRRNDISSIPDRVLESILMILAHLCDRWWWTCELQVWEQVMLLVGSILLPPTQTKSKVHDDHTKEAACRCIFQLTRRRTNAEDNIASSIPAEERFRSFQELSVSRKFFPILGQLFSNLLVASQSSHRPLQLLSLEICEILILDYLGIPYAPIVLPGVVSTMCKILTPRAAGSANWQNSEVAVAALRVLEGIVVQGISDEACIGDGAVRSPLTDISELSDLASLKDDDATVASVSVADTSVDPPQQTPFTRTPSWLRATSTQLHIALNTLTPLLRHPSPSVLLAFSATCSNIFSNTTITMVSTRPLLLSNLLTLCVSDFPSVSNPTRSTLVALLSRSVIEMLMEMAQSYLTSLPRVLLSHSETRVQHVAQQVVAVCILSKENAHAGSIANAIGILLGPTGGIEKWGYSLLNVLEFSSPNIVPVPNSRLLEISAAEFAGGTQPGFVKLEIKQVQSRECVDALERMLQELARAAGESALYSIEWFAERAKSGTASPNVAAGWLACRLLEGVSGLDLGTTSLSTILQRTGKRLDKVCRWIARNISEGLGEPNLRDDEASMDDASFSSPDETEAIISVDYRKGVNQLTTLLDSKGTGKTPAAKLTARENLEALHTITSLHLMAISSSVLGPKFRPMLLYALYPLIRSLVSPNLAVSSVAQSTLEVVTNATAYASPANLVLANFDYALNSASLHLSRHNLDVQATKVLATLVRLVGGDVVERAGDVVEECFDRLDEYHGYGVVVEGLVDVLGEVIRVIRTEDEAKTWDYVDLFDPKGIMARKQAEALDSKGPRRFEQFISWYTHRHDPPTGGLLDDVPVGPVPQHAWGPSKDDNGDDGDRETDREENGGHEPQGVGPTQLQALTEQIVARSLFFLTHPSPLIRARILSLLASAVPILRSTESSLLPSVHTAWPFIVNRLGDSEPFVITEAANLVEALVINVGDYMEKRVCDDVWPRFKTMLRRLEEADTQSALTRLRRDWGKPGATRATRTAYSVSHRMYRSLLGALVGVVRGTQLRDDLAWDVALSCRRFLSAHAHVELQKRAEELYRALGASNSEMIWLVLFASIHQTTAPEGPPVSKEGSDEKRSHQPGAPTQPNKVMQVKLPGYLKVPPEWDIGPRVDTILASLR